MVETFPSCGAGFLSFAPNAFVSARKTPVNTEKSAMLLGQYRALYNDGLDIKCPSLEAWLTAMVVIKRVVSCSEFQRHEPLCILSELSTVTPDTKTMTVDLNDGFGVCPNPSRQRRDQQLSRSTPEQTLLSSA